MKANEGKTEDQDDLPIDDLLQQMPADNRNGVTRDKKPSSENGNESGLMKPNEG